jgi:hypothetical protein
MLPDLNRSGEMVNREFAEEALPFFKNRIKVRKNESSTGTIKEESVTEEDRYTTKTPLEDLRNKTGYSKLSSSTDKLQI